MEKIFSLQLIIWWSVYLIQLTNREELTKPLIVNVDIIIKLKNISYKIDMKKIVMNSKWL